MRSLHVRAYRALLRVYPRRFRAEYEEEMCRVFAQQLHYARVMEGWPGVVRVWARSLADLVTTAPSEHFEEEVPVARPVGGSGWPSRVVADPPGRRWVLIGLAPLWAFPFFLFFPTWGPVFFLAPPSIFGLPAGLVMCGLALGWGLLGFPAVADPRWIRLRPVLLILLGLCVGAAFFGVLKLPPAFRVLAGIAPAGLAYLWWAVGRTPVSDTRSSTVRLVALLVFTIPSTVVVLVAPALVLIVLNLTT